MVCFPWRKIRNYILSLTLATRGAVSLSLQMPHRLVNHNVAITRRWWIHRRQRRDSFRHPRQDASFQCHEKSVFEFGNTRRPNREIFPDSPTLPGLNTSHVGSNTSRADFLNLVSPLTLPRKASPRNFQVRAREKTSRRPILKISCTPPGDRTQNATSYHHYRLISSEIFQKDRGRLRMRIFLPAHSLIFHNFGQKSPPAVDPRPQHMDTGPPEKFVDYHQHYPYPTHRISVDRRYRG